MSVLYSGKLSRGKLSQISRFYGYLGKCSLQNLGMWYFWWQNYLLISESFLRESLDFHSFLPWKFLAIQYMWLSQVQVEDYICMYVVWMIVAVSILWSGSVRGFHPPPSERYLFWRSSVTPTLSGTVQYMDTFVSNRIPNENQPKWVSCIQLRVGEWH